MSRTGGVELRLLLSTVGPDRRRAIGISTLLLVSLVLRLAMPAMLGWFVDRAIAGAELSLLSTIAGAYVVVALVAEGLRLVVTYGAVDLSWRAGNRLRERLAHHALRLEMAWHGRHSPGKLIERIDGDVEAMVVFFANVLVYVLGNAVLMVGMLVVAFVIDPFAGMMLTVTSVVGAFVLIRLRSAAVPSLEAEREANAVLYGDLEERLGGLEDLRANGAGRYAVHRLHANSARSWRAARRASLLGDGSYALAAIAFAVGSVATLALGFWLYNAGMVTIGAVIALFRYSEMLRQPLEQIAEQLKEFQRAIAGARRASQLLATEPSLPDGSVSLSEFDAATPGRALPIDFDHVTFAYRSDNEPVLHDIDLHIPAGSHVGIIGRTGSGKTTLSRLVLRLWEATEGTVRVGGIDVADLQRSALRSRVTVVTQDVELFRASVRDNLTLFGALDASDDELVGVLGRVGLDRWLTTQTEGLDTVIEGGSSLSAGQAQLLAMARAFLSDPGIVILDEASSRLDPDTESRLNLATQRLLAGRTALIVAHRLATLDRVDSIVVLDQGRIVEHGARDQLVLDPASRYSRLLAIADQTEREEGLGA